MSQIPEITIIVGSGRSGTSFVQRTLRDTMDIGFFREPKYVIPIYRQLFRFGDLSQEKNLLRLLKYILEEEIFFRFSEVFGIKSLVDEILSRINESSYSGVLYAIFGYIAQMQGKSRLGYKFPSDVTNINELALIFPTARFIHMLRDGRDVAISLLDQDWGAENLYAGSKFWARQTLLGRKAGSQLPGRYFETRYEDLILNTEDVAFSLGKFLNNGKRIEQINEFVNQVQKTKETSSVYRWKKKLSAKQVYICEAASSSELEANGYELIYCGNAKIPSVYEGYYLFSDFFLRASRNLWSRFF